MILEGAIRDRRHNYLRNYAGDVPEENETECAYDLWAYIWGHKDEVEGLGSRPEKKRPEILRSATFIHKFIILPKTRETGAYLT